MFPQGRNHLRARNAPRGAGKRPPAHQAREKNRRWARSSPEAYKGYLTLREVATRYGQFPRRTLLGIPVNKPACLRPSTVNLCECMPRIPEAWYPRRTSLGFSVNSPSYKLTCSVPLIVGGSPWLNGVWSNIPLKVPVPPEGMVLPSTLPP